MPNGAARRSYHKKDEIRSITLSAHILSLPRGPEASVDSSIYHRLPGLLFSDAIKYGLHSQDLEGFTRR
jgi:hypothetical protein